MIKLVNRFIFPITIFGFMLLCLFPFQACEKEDDECTCDTCDTNQMVRKPNIYLYPTENCSISVTLHFPKGGEIVTSIPAYNGGWNCYVDTQGIIDNEYDYLFYESVQPDIWQMEEGWIIEKTKLEIFFRQNLMDYGFYGREIDDFVEYWIPRLSAYDSYEIYPQETELINTIIDLDIIPQPERILRLFYVIKGASDHNNSLIAPETINNFERAGFIVTEWGVILK